MASADKIVVQIPADRRLARVARTVAFVAARGAGLPAAQARAFAAEVARRFTVFSAAAVRGGAVALTFEIVREGLDLEIRRGGRRQALKARKRPRKTPARPSSRPR